MKPTYSKIIRQTNRISLALIETATIIAALAGSDLLFSMGLGFTWQDFIAALVFVLFFCLLFLVGKSFFIMFDRVDRRVHPDDYGQQ